MQDAAGAIKQSDSPLLPQNRANPELATTAGLAAVLAPAPSALMTLGPGRRPRIRPHPRSDEVLSDSRRLRVGSALGVNMSVPGRAPLPLALSGLSVVTLLLFSTACRPSLRVAGSSLGGRSSTFRGNTA